MRIKIIGRQLPKHQGVTGPSEVSNDDAWIRKILEYEFAKGGFDPATGKAIPLTNWGYNSRINLRNQPVNPATGKPWTIDDAVGFFKQDFLPKVQQYPMGMRERAADFLYNAGRDPRIYMLDQYLRTVGDKSGLPNRMSYNVDINQNPQDWAKIAPQFEAEWNKYSADINKLPLDQQIKFLDQGKHFYYSHINQIDGKPNPAYTQTHGPRVDMWGPYSNPATTTTTQTKPTIQGPVVDQPGVRPRRTPERVDPSSFMPQRPNLFAPKNLNPKLPSIVPGYVGQTGVFSQDDDFKIGFQKPTNDEELAQEFYKQNPMESQPTPSLGQQAVTAGIGPTREMDEVDRMYQTNSQAERAYDDSLMSYHLMNRKNNPDRKDYMKWYNDKYPLTTGQKIKNTVTNVSNATRAAVDAGVTINEMIQEPINKMKQKRYLRSMREQNLFANPTMPMGDERGDYTVNEGLFRPDQMQPVNKGMYTNKYYGSRMIGEQGGTLDYNDNPQVMKIRITGRNMEYGGQMGFGLDLNRRRVHVDMPDDPTENLSSSISEDPNPDEPYVLEAEKDETIKRPDGSFATFQGKYHSNGGVKTTAEQTPEGSYIYSRVLKEKRPEVLQAMGVTSKKAYKKGISYADLTKPFNTNKYVAILNDRNADPYHQKSAQMMKDKFDDKHALAALAQESMKGFPEGIPTISQDILAKAAYGGFLDKYQVTGQVKGKSQQVFDDETTRLILQSQNQGKRSVASPRMAKGDNSVPMMQGRQQTGLFGDITPEELDEFAARHNWYFDNKTKWNPRSKADVEDFQREYNKKFREKYGYDYFNDKRRVSRIDGKFGEYTYNALNLKEPEAAPPAEPVQRYMCTPNGVVAISPNDPVNSMGSFAMGVYNSYEEALANCKGAKEPPKEKDEVVPGDYKKPNVKEPPFGYMYPDIRRMYTARRYAPEMILPYYADINATIPQPVFEDWRAKAAARQAMYNTGARTMGNYGPTQGLAANLSFMAGQQGDPLIQDIAQTEGRNIGIANPFSMAQAEVINKENEYNTMNKDRRYAGWATARQQYKNALRQRAKDIDTADIAGWNNRSKLHMLNMTNPYYYMNPWSGRSVFKGGLGIDKIANNWMGNQDGSNMGYKESYQKAITMGMPEADARKYAYAVTTGYGATSSKSNPFAALQQQASYYSPLTAASAYGYNQAADDDD